MLAKHPLDTIPSGEKFSRDKVAEALRLSIIAELDAINLYLQLAERINDEGIRKVFEDVAREEKTHVGEFLALLKSIDPEQAEELRAGAGEVRELTGIETMKDPVEKPGKTRSNETFMDRVWDNIREFIDRHRVLRNHLAHTVIGPGRESVLFYDPTAKKLRPIMLHEHSVIVRVPQRLINVADADNDPSILTPLYDAAARFAVGEDKLILEGSDEFKGILNAPGIITAEMGDWSQPGVPVGDIASALKVFGENGIVPPYKLFIHSSRFAELVKVHERTGVMELERVRRLVGDVVVLNTLPPDTALLVAVSSNYLDVAYGVDTAIEHIGPEDGFQVYRLWETLAVRIKEPMSIIVMKQKT